MKVFWMETIFTHFVHINIFINKNTEFHNKSNRHYHANFCSGLWIGMIIWMTDFISGYWYVRNVVWGQHFGKSEKMVSLNFYIFISFFNQYINKKSFIFFKASSYLFVQTKYASNYIIKESTIWVGFSWWKKEIWVRFLSETQFSRTKRVRGIPTQTRVPN